MGPGTAAAGVNSYRTTALMVSPTPVKLPLPLPTITNGIVPAPSKKVGEVKVKKLAAITGPGKTVAVPEGENEKTKLLFGTVGVQCRPHSKHEYYVRVC